MASPTGDDSLWTVVTRGKGSVESVFVGSATNDETGTPLEGRAIPMGNHDLYWSTCTVKVRITV